MLSQLFFLGLTFVNSAMSIPAGTLPQAQTAVDPAPKSFLTGSQTNSTDVTSAIDRRKITVQLCKHKHFVDCVDLEFSEGRCYNPWDITYMGFGNQQLTSYNVRNGCCDFYEEPGCPPYWFMFNANYRSDGWLSNEHNDKFQSIYCWDHCAVPP